MKLTESQLRRIIVEEVGKSMRGNRINESRDEAENVLAGAMDKYVDQMTATGYDYNEICISMEQMVKEYCDRLLKNISAYAAEQRNPQFPVGLAGDLAKRSMKYKTR
jgi:hypothetical protein